MRDILAMDRAPSVRSMDANGFLHVEVSNISKANVCPYMGREIPGADELGLDPDRVYQLYRDPAELAAAAPTFNNLPILAEHLPVMPDDLPEALIIGSTGTDAEFDGTYLRNSLVIWRQSDQDAIEAGRKRELSCGYRYIPDMTAGRTEEGLQYDGVMRSIIGNHVALVIEGRAGPDVMVGDERMKKLASGIAALVKPHLAADAALDAEGLAAAILALDEDDKDDADKAAEDEDPGAKEDDDPKQAEDEDGDDEDDKDDKPAMDAATVARLISQAESRGRKAAAALDSAKSDVKPLVGEVVGMDSAETVYRFALKAKGYAADAIGAAPLATLKAMVAREVTLDKPMAVDAAPFAEGKLSKIVGDLPTLIRS